METQDTDPEDESWLDKIWCGAGGCHCNRSELRLHYNDGPEPPVWMGRAAPRVCGGGSWTELELSEIAPATAEDTEGRMQEIHISSGMVTDAPCREEIIDCVSVANGRCESGQGASQNEAAPGLLLDSCGMAGTSAPTRTAKVNANTRGPSTAYAPMRECRQSSSVEDGYTPVVPREAPAQEPPTEGSSASLWTQRAIIVSVSSVAAGAFATAAGGVLPVAIAAGSMGFTLGLLSSILGIRVGRWVS